MKGKRQEKILELIEKYDIETQEELTRLLQEEGFSVTQGTVSRDIRNLGLTKVTGSDRRQKYAPLRKDLPQGPGKFRRVLSEGILSMEDASHILVIKTVPGMAMACAAALDALEIRGIVGCIAGDDTIFCAVKQEEDILVVRDSITKAIRD